jgi:hypothetical protein
VRHGAGTFAFILLFAILVVLLILCIFCQVKIFKLIFAGYLAALIIVNHCDGVGVFDESDEVVTETNEHFKATRSPFPVGFTTMNSYRKSDCKRYFTRMMALHISATVKTLLTRPGVSKNDINPLLTSLKKPVCSPQQTEAD